MNVNERIKKIRENICDDSNKEFAKRMDAAPNTVNNYVRDGYSVGDGVLYKILEKFPEVNKEWLFNEEGDMINKIHIFQKAKSYLQNTLQTPAEISKNTDIALSIIQGYILDGKEPSPKDAMRLIAYFENAGEMLKEPEKQDVLFYDSENAPISRRLIPLWDEVASTGGLRPARPLNTTPSGHVDEFVDPGSWFKNITNAIRHYGDSMIEYPPGSILALKEVHDFRLIIPGKNYVIETTEYLVTKKIRLGNNPDFILAYSTNEDKYDDGSLIHEPFPIARELILRMFEVLGYVVKQGNGTLVNTNQK